MHPTEIIEFIIIISFLLRPNLRKYGWMLATVVFILYCLFFFIRPHWIDKQINDKVVMLDSYLEKQYPSEEWVITAVPHREEGYKHLNPYYIGVIFNGVKCYLAIIFSCI